MSQIFNLKGLIYIIHEFHQTDLVDQVKQQHPRIEEVQNVLNDVFSGLIQLYQAQYATRSLRPEHIIYTNNKQWKIQSFVLDEKQYNIQSEFCWSPKFASLEDRAKKGQLPEQQIDEQLVWNLGIIGLYMLLGPQFNYETINNDNDIPWDEVKQMTKEKQFLFDFLKSALTVDFNERLKLKDVFNHKIFASRWKGYTDSPFQSYDKYIDGRNQKKEFSDSVSGDELKSIHSLTDCIQHAKYFGEVEKYVNEIHFKNNFDVILIRYLCFKISFDMLLQIKNSIGKQRRKSLLLKQLQMTLGKQVSIFKQKKQKYYKTLRDYQSATSEIEEIRNMLENKDMSDESIWDSRAIKTFITMAGCIYSEITMSSREVLNESKQRTICFYSLAVYLLFYYNREKFNSNEVMKYVENNTLRLNRLINEGQIESLIELTQQLIKDHFVIDERK